MAEALEVEVAACEYALWEVEAPLCDDGATQVADGDSPTCIAMAARIRAAARAAARGVEHATWTAGGHESCNGLAFDLLGELRVL